MASITTTARTFRVRRSTLAALERAAATAGLSPSKTADAILRLWLADWLAENASAAAIPGHPERQ
jgi:hypothetical protein